MCGVRGYMSILWTSSQIVCELKTALQIIVLIVKDVDKEMKIF